MRQSRVRGDLPPELCEYRDEGCEVSASCLGCPLPRCVFEESPGGQGRRRRRDEEVRRAYREVGGGAEELAQRFGVSRRTVYRILKRGGP